MKTQASRITSKTSRWVGNLPSMTLVTSFSSTTWRMVSLDPEALKPLYYHEWVQDTIWCQQRRQMARWLAFFQSWDSKKTNRAVARLADVNGVFAIVCIVDKSIFESLRNKLLCFVSAWIQSLHWRVSIYRGKSKLVQPHCNLSPDYHHVERKTIWNQSHAENCWIILGEVIFSSSFDTSAHSVVDRNGFKLW